jgi:hypothetical protein
MAEEVSLVIGALVSVAVLILLAYMGFRAVRWARKTGSSSGLIGSAIESVDIGGALNPAREVLQERRRTTREYDGASDGDRPPK